MAYSTDNPPKLMLSAVGGVGLNIFAYDSADASTVVRVDGYITNAADLGMKVGDIMFQHDSVGATVAHQYVVLAINADSSANLSNGSSISVTDT